MNLKVPSWAVRGADAFSRWGDVLVWRVGPLNIRRIDFTIALSGFVCVAYYGYVGGWLAALQGAVAWLLMLMIALWMF